MKNPARRSTIPEWKQFLDLSEDLLRHSATNDQRRLITTYVNKMLRAEAEVWLSAPFYPLPGEAPYAVLPDCPAPQIVLEASQLRQLCCTMNLEQAPCNCNDALPAAAAVPMVTQGLLLGVIHVSRPEQTFSPEELDTLNGLANYAAVAMQVMRNTALKNWRYEQLTLVRSVASQIANVTDLKELCARVTRLIQETFRYYYVAIFTIDPNDQNLTLKGNSLRDGPDSNLTPVVAVRMGKGMVGSAAETGNEALAHDTKTDPRYLHVDTLPETRSEFSIPLKVEDRVLGVLDVQSDKSDSFHEVDLLVLRSLADAIALAVEGANLFNEQQLRADQISVVLEISHKINSILDLDELFEQVVQLIRERFDYPFVHIFTVHPIRREVKFRAGSGPRSRKMQKLGTSYDLNAPTGIIPYVARTGKTLLANDVRAVAIYRDSEFQPERTRSELAIPLVFGEEVQGVLDVQSEQPNDFDDNDISLLESIAASISVAMRNANLFRTERWRRQVADSFRDVAALISANISTDELLHIILDRLKKNLPCEVSAIWLLDEIPGDGRPPVLRLAAVQGTDVETLSSAQNDATVLSMVEVLDHPSPIIRTANSAFGPLGVAKNYPANYSSIAAPMRSGAEPLGILALAHPTPDRYGSEARDMVTTFANYAALAIQNARLYSQAQEEAWTSTVLLQISEATQTTHTVEDLAETIVRITPLLVGVQRCAIFLWEETRRVYSMQASYGLEQITPSLVLHEDHYPGWQQLRQQNRPVFICDPEHELGINFPDDGQTQTLVLLPLLVRGELLGALLVNHIASDITGVKNSFQEQTLSILQGIAQQTGVALESIRLTEARLEEGYVTAVLLQVAQAVASQSSLSDVLDTIIHLLPILVGVDACSIYLWDERQKLFHPAQAFTGSHVEEDELLSISFAAGEFDLIDQTFNHNHLYFCPMSRADILPEEWSDLGAIALSELPSPSAYPGQTWLLGLPLAVKGDVFGVMVVQETTTRPESRERRIEIFNGIAQQIALALQNDQLTEEMVDRERMEREFQLARQIQQAFLPSEQSGFPGWQIAARWQTARQVGGDFYDIFQLDDDRLALVIADVSDKGMPAALYMTVTRTLIRATLQDFRSPATVLERVNRRLALDSQNGMFITTALGILNLNTGKMVYANAGHNLPLIMRAAHDTVDALPRGGIALAVLEEIELEDHEITLRPGDYLLFYTDGVTDTFAPNGETFGETRLVEALRACAGFSASDLLGHLDRYVADFRQEEAQFDDLTILVVRREPVP